MERIISNKIQCNHRGEIIESKSVHNFVTCKCGACSVDGGQYYLRCYYKISKETDCIELGVVEE